MEHINNASSFLVLSPEQIIMWLESMREWTFEVWKNNPELYLRYQEQIQRDRIQWAEKEKGKRSIT